MAATHSASDEAKKTEAEAKAKKQEESTPPVSIFEGALTANEEALEASKDTAAVRAKAVAVFDAIYDDLANLKRRVEYVEASPVRESKLWAVLAGVDSGASEG